jgi:hypothetical protein
MTAVYVYGVGSVPLSRHTVTFTYYFFDFQALLTAQTSFSLTHVLASSILAVAHRFSHPFNQLPKGSIFKPGSRFRHMFLQGFPHGGSRGSSGWSRCDFTRNYQRVLMSHHFRQWSRMTHQNLQNLPHDPVRNSRGKPSPVLITELPKVVQFHLFHFNTVVT